MDGGRVMSLGPAFDGQMDARTADAVRVLQFVSVFAIGGTERQVVNLAQGLDRSRFDLHFACFDRCGAFLGDIEATGSPLTEYRIDCLYSGKTLRQQLRFARNLRQHRVDVVHAYGFAANTFAVPAARLAGARAIVASIRDTGDHLTPAKRRAQRMACRLADAVLVNADAVKRQLIGEGYAADRISVIGNGITLSRFGHGGEDGRLRRELGLVDGAPLVAVFSRLNRLKGIEYFLEAAAVVAGRFPQARFAVVGEDPILHAGAIVSGPYKRELVAYAARLGIGDRVTFTGFRLDVPKLLAEVAVSVLPSLSEGLSNAILESMAAGVPVVATAVGGNPEAVQDGVTGLLVPPRDADSLARAISTLLEDRDLAARLGRAGRQRVVERFSDERMVRETEQFYLALLSRKGFRVAASGLKESTA
jgi:glycosyltransferase involved in cell wall biosynthesis